jgi:hypothetical protein
MTGRKRQTVSMFNQQYVQPNSMITVCLVMQQGAKHPT